MAEFVEMRAQRIHGNGAAFDELRAGPEQDGAGLAVDQLGFDEAHGRPQRRLDDRLCIGAIILVALDEGLDVSRRDQQRRMPDPGQGAGPMMCSGAGRLRGHEPLER